jgi:hypothetical protein
MARNPPSPQRRSPLSSLAPLEFGEPVSGKTADHCGSAATQAVKSGCCSFQTLSVRESNACRHFAVASAIHAGLVMTSQCLKIFKSPTGSAFRIDVAEVFNRRNALVELREFVGATHAWGDRGRQRKAPARARARSFARPSPLIAPTGELT